MGAVTAAVIAARQRRVQEIVDAFRLADATAPDRARSLETLALSHDNELHSLVVNGILMPGERDGTYYLSEVGYMANRNRRHGLKAVVIVMAVLAILGAILIPIMATRG